MAQAMIALVRELTTKRSSEKKLNVETDPYAPYGCRFEWLCATEFPCHTKYDEETWEEAYKRKKEDNINPFYEEYKNNSRGMVCFCSWVDDCADVTLPSFIIPEKIISPKEVKMARPPMSLNEIKATIKPKNTRICSSSMRIVSKAIGLMRSEKTTVKGLDLLSSMKKQLTREMIEKTGVVKYVKRVQSIPQFSRHAELLLVELAEILHPRAGSCSSEQSSSSDSV